MSKKYHDSKKYQVSKKELFLKLGSGKNGMSEENVLSALELHGYNELEEEKKESLGAIFLRQFRDFLVIILIGAAVISGILGDLESAGVILLVITMNAILGTVQHCKAQKSLDSLKQLSAPHTKVKRNGMLCVIPSREVVPGDLVILEAGDYVPADGRIVESASLKLNESALTGESVPVEKKDCMIQDEVSLGDRINMVYAGSFVTYGRGVYLVTDTAMETEVGKIATLLKNTKEHKTPLQMSLDQFGRRLSILILAICGVIFATSVMQGETVMNAFMFAVALAVAAIPEALSSIVTIVLAFGTQKLAKEHAIIRKLQAVEGLGSVSVICSDKTGTLTQNKMTVKKVYVDGKLKESNTMSAVSKVESQLTEYAVLCNDAVIGDGLESGDPTEVALLHMAQQLEGVSGNIVEQIREKYSRIGELPFDSDRKLMSTLHEIEGRRILIVKGATDVLFSRVKQYETSDGISTFTEREQEEIEAANEAMSEEGLRVLGVAYREVRDEEIGYECESELIFVGLIAMMDPPREESRAAVQECIRAGIRPIMITGDHKVTAAAIARSIGILDDTGMVVEGSELDCLSDQELLDYVERVSVYARVSPEHKIRIVRAWQERGNIVAMTGDGVNDAPALKQADIGVAMGVTGTEVAKDAAAMVLTDDNFATIIKAVENGRNVYLNIKKSIKFLLSGNTAGIIAVLYASLMGLAVPFAPVHLLFINLLTDSLPAIALGLDPHSKEVMNQMPRSKNESILTKEFMMGIGIEGLVIGVNTMIAYYIGLHSSGAGLASTMAFATLCLSRLVHGFNSKSDWAILGTKEMWNNKYLLGAFATGFLLLNGVLLIPALWSVFKITPLSMSMLFTVYGLSLVNLFVIQAIKWLLGRNKKKVAKVEKKNEFVV